MKSDDDDDDDDDDDGDQHPAVSTEDFGGLRREYLRRTSEDFGGLRRTSEDLMIL